VEFLQTRLHDVRAGAVRDEGDRAMTVFARQERPRELLAGDFPAKLHQTPRIVDEPGGR